MSKFTDASLLVWVVSATGKLADNVIAEMRVAEIAPANTNGSPGSAPPFTLAAR
jgi:hypothetical protein